MSKNIKAVPTAEYNAVIATANQYVEGLRIGSAQGVAQAFHKEAVMYGFTNGELLGGPIKNLFDFVEKNGAAPEISTRLPGPLQALHGVVAADCTAIGLELSGSPPACLRFAGAVPVWMRQDQLARHPHPQSGSDLHPTSLDQWQPCSICDLNKRALDRLADAIHQGHAQKRYGAPAEPQWRGRLGLRRRHLVCGKAPGRWREATHQAAPSRRIHPW